ncbi:MAG: caspase family protein [Kiritimatiellales bacterium]|nr:caspase family protein [Kiritimatiellales bacterium]
MKAIYHILFGALVLLVAACGRKEQAAPAPKPDAPAAKPLRYHALVIGIGDYTGTGWPQLGTARADAAAVGDILRTGYGFDVVELVDRQATRGNILRALEQLMHLTDNDALLIYFAGHGFYDEQMDEGYWIPYGAQRSRMEQPAKEDWLWNSSINRVLGAVPARHILLVADTCYGGSLFRGDEEPVKSVHWYQRAMAVPSRYLITSGNLEPVLDSGIRHSVFAQEILNFLQYADQDVFSASDIAVSIRAKVSELTGQLVRMGPLALPAHAGGEFVFVRSETALPSAPAIAEEKPEEPIFRSGLGDRLQQLATRIETHANNLSSAFVRPRILACLGPTGSDPDETALVRTRLNECLSSMGGSILVEREAFDSLLKEVELGRSGLADSRAATEIGKLLPASLILFGEIIHAGDQKEIHLRMVDTETSRVLCSASASFTNPDGLDPACQSLAERIMKTMNQARPLLLPASRTGNGTLQAGWGRFHGARVGDTFDIITRAAIDTIAPQETALGTARLLSLGEEQSVFQPEWNGAETNQSATLWLKATL